MMAATSATTAAAPLRSLLFSSLPSPPLPSILKLRFSRACLPSLSITNKHAGARVLQSEAVVLRCSHSNSSSQIPSQDDNEPPQEAVLKAISEVSKSEGRVAQTTNVVIGGTVTGDSKNEWLVLDQQVNSYPTVRGFTAIGTGGDDFVQAMVVAVESVIQQPIPEGRVSQKLSSRGKYVSVKIGPIRVLSSEQ
ncbi:uncharacterized protein LOC18428178, partial [Amborella trichopoda]